MAYGIGKGQEDGSVYGKVSSGDGRGLAKAVVKEDGLMKASSSIRRGRRHEGRHVVYVVNLGDRDGDEDSGHVFVPIVGHVTDGEIHLKKIKISKGNKGKI